MSKVWRKIGKLKKLRSEVTEQQGKAYGQYKAKCAERKRKEDVLEKAQKRCHDTHQAMLAMQNALEVMQWWYQCVWREYGLRHDAIMLQIGHLDDESEEIARLVVGYQKCGEDALMSGKAEKAAEWNRRANGCQIRYTELIQEKESLYRLDEKLRNDAGKRSGQPDGIVYQMAQNAYEEAEALCREIEKELRVLRCEIETLKSEYDRQVKKHEEVSVEINRLYDALL